jgi:hypothetical protein
LNALDFYAEQLNRIEKQLEMIDNDLDRANKIMREIESPFGSIANKFSKSTESNANIKNLESKSASNSPLARYENLKARYLCDTLESKIYSQMVEKSEFSQVLFPILHKLPKGDARNINLNIMTTLR